MSRWKDAYGGHDESPPVRFGDHLAIVSVIDGLTWCTSHEGGVKGYTVSTRSSTRASPMYFRPFAEAVAEAKKANKKSGRSRSIFGRKSPKGGAPEKNSGPNA